MGLKCQCHTIFWRGGFKTRPYPVLAWQGQLPLDFREIQFPQGDGGPGFQLLDFLLHQFLFQVPVLMDKLAVFLEQFLFQVRGEELLLS